MGRTCDKRLASVEILLTQRLLQVNSPKPPATGSCRPQRIPVCLRAICKNYVFYCVNIALFRKALKNSSKSVGPTVFFTLEPPGAHLLTSWGPPGGHFGSPGALLGASWELPDLIFTYFRTSGAHFQAPWPVWGAAHWRSGHGALVAPEGAVERSEFWITL